MVVYLHKVNKDANIVSDERPDCFYRSAKAATIGSFFGFWQQTCFKSVFLF